LDTEVRPLTSEDMTSAVRVLARGMRDNPNHVAVWGDDRDCRVQAHERFGFETVGEVDVLGVPNWFMRRSAR
jgi:hypothetical protein